MQLLLRVDDPEEAASLYEWLSRERTVATNGDLQWARSHDPGHQGIDIEVLSLAVSSTLTVADLVLQILLNWRNSRPHRPAVTIERPDGTVVRVDTSDPDVLADVVRKVENG